MSGSKEDPTKEPKGSESFAAAAGDLDWLPLLLVVLAEATCSAAFREREAAPPAAVAAALALEVETGVRGTDAGEAPMPAVAAAGEVLGLSKDDDAVAAAVRTRCCVHDCNMSNICRTLTRLQRLSRF